MSSVTALSARPTKAETRSAAQLPSSTALTILVNNDSKDITATPSRFQFLSRRHIPESRLGLLASLIWEERADG